MSKNTVQTRFKATGTAEMQRKLRKVEKSLNNVAKEGVSLKSAMSKMGGGVGAAVAAVGVLAAGAGAAVIAFKKLSEAMIKLSNRGADLSAVSNRFEALASPELANRMQRASGQLVNSFDLMRASNVALANEMLSEDQWVNWTELVTRAAQDTGRGVTQSLDQLAQAFAGGGVEFLSQLGVNMGAIKDRLKELDVSMESGEGRAEALRLANEQLRDSYGDIDNSAGNTGDAFQQIVVVLENFRDAVAEAFAEDERLIETLEEVAEKLRPLIEHAPDFAIALVELGEAMVEVAVQSAPLMIAAFQTAIDVMAGLIQAHADVMGAFGRDNTHWNMMAESLKRVSFAAGRVGTSLAEMARMASRAREELEDLSAQPAWIHPGAAGAYLSRPVTDDEGLTDLAAEPQDAPVWEEIRTPQRRRRRGGRRRLEKDEVKDPALHEQNMRDLMDSAASGMSVVDDLYNEIATLQGEIRSEDEARHEQMMEELEAEKQAELDALEVIRQKQEEVAQAALNRIRDQANATAEWGSVGAGSISMIGDAVGQLAAKKQRDLDVQRQSMREMGKSEAEIKAATQDREKAVKRMQKAEGAFLVAYNVAMAAVEVARAIGSVPNPITIASHAAAAVAHGVAASIAAAKLGGGGGGGGAAVSASIPTAASFTPADDSSMEMPVAEDPRQTNVVNYYSLGRSGEDLGRALREADYEFERADGRASVGAGVSYS